MTIDEIFPRSIFPLRARTEVALAGTNVVRRITVFYQMPFASDGQQRYGSLTSVVIDGKEKFSMADRPAHPEESNRGKHEFWMGNFYLGEESDLRLISEEEAKKFMEENFPEAGEYFDDDPPNLEECTWQQF